jgi:hypothetical protein
VTAWALAQHPDFWTSAESDVLYHLFGKGHLWAAVSTALERSDGSWLTVNKVSRAEFNSHLGLGLNALFTSRSSGRRWIDQSPTYTLILTELASVFPAAKFVHVLRDGRSVVTSMLNTGFDTAWATDFAEACRTWTHFVRHAREFEIRQPDRCLTVRLADLEQAPADAFEKVFSFLGAAVSDAASAYLAKNRINSSYADAEHSEDSAYGLACWDSWSDAERELFRDLAGDALVDTGFASAEQLS